MVLRFLICEEAQREGMVVLQEKTMGMLPVCINDMFAAAVGADLDCRSVLPLSAILFV